MCLTRDMKGRRRKGTRRSFWTSFYTFWRETKSREDWGMLVTPISVCSPSDPTLRSIKKNGNALLVSIKP